MTGGPRTTAAEIFDQIRRHIQSGDLAGAKSVAEQGMAALPDDAAIADAAGDLSLKSGDAAAAEKHFFRATELEPSSLPFALNHVVALQRLGRHREALEILEGREAQGRSVTRYASMRAMSHRALGDAASAAKWYDTLLALEPRHPRGLHGRARVALERGEADAPARFDAALAVIGNDADIWLGKAQALEVAGDIEGARTLAQNIVSQLPGVTAALELLSGLLLAENEPDFTAPFAEAAQRAPGDPQILLRHIAAFSGLSMFAQAAEVAADARTRFSNEPYFALLEATYASSAGDTKRASSIFAELPDNVPHRALHEARHALRLGDFELADKWIERALAQDPWDIAAWAQRGIVWRLTDDARAHWLHGQEGLIQLRPLQGRSGLIDDCVDALRDLHRSSAMPLGQSLRGGTQTRGILFQRTEPVFAELKQAILATLQAYREDLPPGDPAHPLLRHRATPWDLAGSWSVRLTGEGDRHAAHIHPQGVISSALYLVVPQESDEGNQAGWLEIGRPPGDLAVDLPPIRSIRPQEGHLALFPSTAYHGTTPFRSSERMTVAFDVVTAIGKGDGQGT